MLPSQLPTLLDELLQEQQEMTSVERFSARHEALEADGKKAYQDLIPIRKPSSGEQYAFKVNLDACSACKACVVACHSLNGLDEGEAWRDVGAVVRKGLVEQGAQEEVLLEQTVTTACHHCLDPACSNGCPTRAYEKLDSGVVRHLDDQCIGCRYCELKCPYEVPKYNDRLGIVRKCDMCHERLAEGEAPACVQACPNEAIEIVLVEQEEVLAKSQNDEPLVPGTVGDAYTQPTTQFEGMAAENNKGFVAADAEVLRVGHGHTPLAWMLVMTQAGVGALCVDAFFRLKDLLLSGGEAEASAVSLWFGLPWTLWVGVVMAFAGLIGSIAHLGRPLHAWKAFLGWRTSWLSREVMAFGGWAKCMVAYVAVAAMLPVESWTWAHGVSALAVVLSGVVALWCSVMVYVDTRRPWWGLSMTAAKFVGTAAIFFFLLSPEPSLRPFAALPLLGLLGLDVRDFLGEKREFSYTGKLLRGPLKNLWVLRVAGALLAMGLMFWMGVSDGVGAAVVLGLLALSELVGRSLFFQAVDEPKMPGGLSK